jgi:hypothetical protein
MSLVKFCTYLSSLSMHNNSLLELWFFLLIFFIFFLFFLFLLLHFHFSLFTLYLPSSVLFSIFLLVTLTFSLVTLHRSTSSFQFLFHCTEYESDSSDNEACTLSYVHCGREKWRQRVWANTQSRVALSDPTGPAGAQEDIRQPLFFKVRVYSKTFHVKFMVDKVVLWQTSFQALRSSVKVITTPVLYIYPSVILM